MSKKKILHPLVRLAGLGRPDQVFTERYMGRTPGEVILHTRTALVAIWERKARAYALKIDIVNPEHGPQFIEKFARGDILWCHSCFSIAERIL